MKNERTRAIRKAREFLLKLLSPYDGGYKRIPKEVRQGARSVLKHFPSHYEIDMMAEEAKSVLESDEFDSDAYYDKRLK